MNLEFVSVREGGGLAPVSPRASDVRRLAESWQGGRREEREPGVGCRVRARPRGHLLELLSPLDSPRLRKVRLLVAGRASS